MSERGNTTHGSKLDDEMKHEDQALVQGHGPGHVEDWRQPEPLPDDTDSAEVRDAAGISDPPAVDFPDRGAAQVVEEGGENA